MMMTRQARSGKTMLRKTKPNKFRHLRTAILVDVDGTLVGHYRNGKRELRPSARSVLQLLSQTAPVFLWSLVGTENGERLLEEFPELRSYVRGCYGKDDFPLDAVDRPFAIDDEALDEPVLQCRHFILESSYFGGAEEGDLVRTATAVVAEIRGGTKRTAIQKLETAETIRGKRSAMAQFSKNPMDSKPDGGSRITWVRGDERPGPRQLIGVLELRSDNTCRAVFAERTQVDGRCHVLMARRAWGGKDSLDTRWWSLVLDDNLKVDTIRNGSCGDALLTEDVPRIVCALEELNLVATETMIAVDDGPAVFPGLGRK